MPGNAPGFPGVRASARRDENMRVEFLISPHTPDEELKLWADYYEATARVLEIMRALGTTPAALEQIVAEEARATGAISRIKEIRGLV